MRHRPVPTMKDVAAMAGVAVSTVSRILNESGYGSERTRRRVLAASSALGYTPSLRARGLRQSRTMAIGVAAPDLDNPVYLSYVKGIENAAGEAGYAVTVCDGQASKDVQARQLARLFGHRVDGLLVIPPVLAPEGLAAFFSAGVPVVPPAGIDDDTRVRQYMEAMLPAMHTAIRALREAGHERVAFVTRKRPMLERGSRPSLVDACRAELAKLGVEIERHLVLRVETTAECRAAVARQHAQGGAPTAYVISPFALAPRLLTALSESGLSVPEDVSIVCHGDSDWALAYRPPLAVIRRDYHAQAAAWVRELLGRLDGRPRGPLPNLAYEFLARGSIGLVRPSRDGPVQRASRLRAITLSASTSSEPSKIDSTRESTK